MPGGTRLKSKIRIASVRLKSTASGSRAKKPPKHQDRVNARLNLLENSSTFIANLLPLNHEVINPHWVAYAGWNNTSGEPVLLYRAQITVPEEPTEKNRQLIFIFTGLQSSAIILQPVLQWGISGMGGGRFWSIASCCAAGQSDPVKRSRAATKVNPGAVVTAVIVGRSLGGGKFGYSCFFDGVDNSRVDIGPVAELKYGCVTLESYNISSRNSYPTKSPIFVSEIDVQDKGGPVIQAWDRQTHPGTHGELATVRRVPGSRDEINLNY